MSTPNSPWDEGRDGSYTGGSYGFGDPVPGDLTAGGDLAAQADRATQEQLPGANTQPGADLPPAGRFTYPWLRGPGGALADD